MRDQPIAATFLCFVLGACGADVRRGLTEDQANRAVLVLQNAGIGAEKASDTSDPGNATQFVVSVPRSALATAVAALDEAGLPRVEESGLLETFRGDRLVPSPDEERARLTAALGGELARSIESIDGVLDARVHLALAATEDSFAAEHPAAKASVFIKYAGKNPPYVTGQIEALVAGAIEGLERDKVSVIGVQSRSVSSPSTPLTSVGPIMVAASSANMLRLILALAVGLHIVLSAAIFWSLGRARSLRASATSPGTT